MGFTEYSGQAVTFKHTNVTGSDAIDSTTTSTSRNVVGFVDYDECGGVNSSFKRLPDQEILDGVEDVYFQDEANCEQYELEVIKFF